MAKKVKYPNGDVYKGKWKHGAPNGKGDMFYQDGRLYSGFWVDGKRSGQGKYIIPLGNNDTMIYDGTWFQDSLLDGNLSSKKYTFHGTFKYYSDGVPKPYYGSLVYTNGVSFEGELSEDKVLINGLSHTSRVSEYIDGKHIRGLTEEMKYVNGNRYEGTICTDTTWEDYLCGDYHQGKFTGVLRDRFPNIGLVKVFYSDSREYRIEFHDTCFLNGNIELNFHRNGKDEIVSYTMNLHKGEMLIDTGGVYKKGTIDEQGRFTGIVQLPSKEEGYSGTVEKGKYRVGRFNYKNGGYREGEWDNGEIINGVSKITTFSFEEDGKYIHGDFHGKRKYFRDTVGEQDGEWRGVVLYNGISIMMTNKYEEDGKYINGDFHGKRKYLQGTRGEQDGEWRGVLFYNGMSKKTGYNSSGEIIYKEDGYYTKGVFRGKLIIDEYRLPSGELVKAFDCNILGDTIIGYMYYPSEYSGFNGTVIKGKRQGVAEYRNSQSRWKNDTLIFFKGKGYDKGNWTFDMTLKGGIYHVVHYSNSEKKYTDTYPYDNIINVKDQIIKSEIEYQIQEEQRLLDQEREKEWEYVGLINVATGWSSTRGIISYRYETMRLYHKRGTSGNVLEDWYGLITNYKVGDDLKQIMKNPSYGQPIDLNILGSPQWGNNFYYYILGVGYSDM